MIYSCRYSCRYYYSTNSRHDICWYVGIGDYICCGERRMLGCTDYDGYVEILWFKTGVTVQIAEVIPEEIVNKFSEYINNPFFDIDLRRYIEKKGLMNVRLYGA